MCIWGLEWARRSVIFCVQSVVRREKGGVVHVLKQSKGAMTKWFIHLCIYFISLWDTLYTLGLFCEEQPQKKKILVKAKRSCAKMGKERTKGAWIIWGQSYFGSGVICIYNERMSCDEKSSDASEASDWLKSLALPHRRKPSWLTKWTGRPMVHLFLILDLIYWILPSLILMLLVVLKVTSFCYNF